MGWRFFNIELDSQTFTVQCAMNVTTGFWAGVLGYHSVSKVSSRPYIVHALVKAVIGKTHYVLDALEWVAMFAKNLAKFELEVLNTKDDF